MDKFDNQGNQRVNLGISKEDSREKKQFWAVVVSSIVLFIFFILIDVFFK